MPSLGDAYGGAADEWERRRLYLGAALLVVGAVVAAPGLVRVTAGVLVALGVPEPPALAIGLAMAGLAVPVVGAALFRWVPADRGLRAVGAAGVLVSALTVALFVTTVPPTALAGPADVPLGLLVVYAIGAMAALFAPVVAAGLAAEERPGRRTGAPSSPAFVRERPSRGGARVPADGGDDRQELTFLLDDEDR